MTILEGAKGDYKTKTLALQFIPKFAGYFEELMPEAFESQLDMCEDEDIKVKNKIRK